MNTKNRDGSSARSRRIALAAVGLAVLVAGPTRADMIAYQYGGVITSADPSTGISPGTRFTGTFSYDPSENVPSSSFPGGVQYNYGTNGPPGSLPDASTLTLLVGDRTIATPQGGLGLTVYQFLYPGQKPSVTTWALASNPDAPITTELELQNAGPPVFPDLSPPSKLNLADFSTAVLLVTGKTNPPGGTTDLYVGTIDSLTPITIATPEPSTLAILGLAAGWWARWGRRSSRD